MASRNMIFRMGVDASDFVSNMRRAGVIAGSVGAQIQKSLSGEGFLGLRKQIAQMESARDAVLSATEGMDLSQPLSKQIQDAMTDQGNISAEIGKVQRKLHETQVMPVANTELAESRRAAKIKLLKEELYGLKGAYASVSDTLAALQGVASDLGPENLKFASTTELKKLDVDIKMVKDSLGEYKKALLDSANAADNAANNTEDLGQSVTRASRSFRAMGSSGSFMERISNQLGRIRSSANRSDLSVGKMLRSIRNISGVSVALRIANGAFGELQGITSNYIRQNEELQTQVDSLKLSVGQALAPAINILTNAMSYLMPYVVGVSNAFGELMANLFGSGWSATASDANKTASAVNGAAAAQERMNRQLMSFDQINKLSGTASGSTSGTDIGTTTTPIEGKTSAWMERFKASFEELFGSEEFQSANLGGKIGHVLQAGLDWLGDEGKEFDWRGVGTKLRENLDSFMDAGWGQSLFSTAGIYVAGFADAIIGFLAPEWEELRQHYEEKGALGAGEYITGFILGIPGAVADLFFSDMIAPFFSGMEEFYREKGNESAADFVGGIGDGFETYGDLIREYFDDHIVSTIVNLLGLDAPYSLFKSIGVMTSEDFAKGIGEGSGSVETELQAMAKTCDETAQTMRDAFSFDWKLPHLKVPHIGVEWDPVDNVLAQFFGVTAFPRLSVSWFAKGGILDGAQIFGRMGSTLLGGGEAGREAILPLDSNTGWMDVLADRISSTLSSQGGDVHATINVIVDGDVVTTKVIRNLRQRSRSGAPVF